MCDVLLQVVVDQVQDILFVHRFTQGEIFDDTFLDWCQSTNYIAFLISLRWVFLKELNSLENLLHNTLYTNVKDVVFLSDSLG